MQSPCNTVLKTNLARCSLINSSIVVYHRTSKGSIIEEIEEQVLNSSKIKTLIKIHMEFDSIEGSLKCSLGLFMILCLSRTFTDLIIFMQQKFLVLPIINTLEIIKNR